ncbi:hypothetical protein PL373_02615 [Tenacibaculum maritimum]|nr:hypothetical protein [Tenacibaculum maritimum]MDB0600065.1 hypothetical protein [Tenacibaculum maritimum]MDB0611180.1 hypothetical protein [Tenacibaculum maritimum]
MATIHFKPTLVELIQRKELELSILEMKRRELKWEIEVLKEKNFNEYGIIEPIIRKKLAKSRNKSLQELAAEFKVSKSAVQKWFDTYMPRERVLKIIKSLNL